MTKEQFNEQYARLCTQLGDTEARFLFLIQKKKNLLKAIEELNNKAAE